MFADRRTTITNRRRPYFLTLPYQHSLRSHPRKRSAADTWPLISEPCVDQAPEPPPPAFSFLDFRPAPTANTGVAAHPPWGGRRGWRARRETGPVAWEFAWPPRFQAGGSPA